MKITILLSAAALLLANACLTAPTQPETASPNDLVLVASTPGDDQVKAILGLEAEDTVDFIRWELVLQERKGDAPNFLLNLNYGLCKQNTLDFMEGGKKKTATGVLSQTTLRGLPVYELRDDKANIAVRLIKLNDNIHHLLSPDGSLMVGNGGWSYTLNRKSSLQKEPEALPASYVSADFFNNNEPETVYDGRTPCLDFAEAYQLPTHDNCIKIKWRLTLRRDPATGQPTTCSIRRILREVSDLDGTWSIQKGTTSNPEAVVYHLKLDKYDKPISLLLGDENVLFMLDGERDLFVGDENFSYTFNRKSKPPTSK